MNSQVSTEPGRIRARMHDNAIGRVTRMYSASIEDIFTEVFQNARRAGATCVDVTLDRSPIDGNFRVSVADDGEGIADPSKLLSYGENGWCEDLVEREDAAGMGFLSLARRGCTVFSRPRTFSCHGQGWKVELEPHHFTGRADALIEHDDGAPWPSGTRVSFETDELHHDAFRVLLDKVRPAAVHFPLPVSVTDNTSEDRPTNIVTRCAFLDGAVHAEPWKGLTFGIFRRQGHRFVDPDVNFHGLTVSARLPQIEPVHGTPWSAFADIRDCPQFELVLPARREPVQTPFLEMMKEAARLAIYRAMALDPDSRPAFPDWKRAKEDGIEITPPPAELLPWRPSVADIDDWRERPDLQPVGEDAVIMAYDGEPPENQAFWHAASTNGLAARVFEEDRRLEGYEWYDRIPRIAGMEFQVSLDGRTYSLEDYPVPERGLDAALPERPDGIFIGLEIVSGAGAQGERSGPSNPAYFLTSEIAFAGEAWSRVDDALPLVSSNSRMEPSELTDLLEAAFFCPSDECDADSRETQHEYFLQDAKLLSTRLLVGDDEARRAAIAGIVDRELLWMVPRDRDAEITIRDRKVTIRLMDGTSGARS